MKIYIFLFLSLLAIFQPIAAQEHKTKAVLAENKTPFIHKDTTIRSLQDFWGKSRLQGHIRNYFMATVNEGDLKDYWTNALGEGIQLTTPEWYGLQVGMKSIFTYKTFSADLNEVDTIVGKSAKWEKELYDVNRPEVGKDIDRLEELFIRFNFSKSFVQYGKMDINTRPLFLRRDGRMMPFVYQGLWSEWGELKDQKVSLGWIDGVSPRGTTEWFSMDEVIGLNNNGTEPNGEKAHYHETAQTKGIAVIGYENDQIEGWKWQMWNYHFHHLTNIIWLQSDYKKGDWNLGLQYVHQNAAAFQEELDYADRYIQPDEKANVLNLLMGYKLGKWQLSAAYFHAFDSGRFLFPRELGREDFYVSQPRSWIDGFGDTDVWMLRFKTKELMNKHLNLDVRLSRTITAGLDTFEFNKYNVPSFYQLTANTTYQFTNELKGLELQFLYIYKITEKSVELKPATVFYGTNYHHFNLIANINF
ncbi:MAG: OprD family outer membrane porin [Chitinophagales bacterium]